MLRHYARPQHMPVLMSRDLVREMEATWPGEFARTRSHRLRLGQELELNFLYHHYLRASRFATRPVGCWLPCPNGSSSSPRRPRTYAPSPHRGLLVHSLLAVACVYLTVRVCMPLPVRVSVCARASCR